LTTFGSFAANSDSDDPHVQDILNHNKTWVAYKNKTEPTYFKDLTDERVKPKVLFFGCSDSGIQVNALLNAK
jgi:carbonic anhydrase